VSGVDLGNGIALAFALFASLALGAVGVHGEARRDRRPDPIGRTADGVVMDASGEAVPVAPYARVVSASTVADEVLLELVEPDRVVAFTEAITHHPTWGFRFAGKRTVPDIADVEAYLALRPDLILIHSFVDPRRVTRLREAGLTVFDLGEMRGLDGLVRNIEDMAALLGQPERGVRLAAELRRRMAAVAADVPPEARERAIYVAIHGVRLYGGTRGTSYHDVLVHAGLLDAAADGFRDWPAYTTEQLLSLDPPWIITRVGMRPVLCENETLASLAACALPGHVVELPGALMSDAGLGMLEATEAVRDAVYGPPREP